VLQDVVIGRYLPFMIDAIRFRRLLVVVLAGRDSRQRVG